MHRDVYSGRLKLFGEEHRETIIAVLNYTSSLVTLERFKEVRTLLRRTIPVAQRVLGDSKDITLRMRKVYAKALYDDPAATLDYLREAVTTLEAAERTARRVMGGANPITVGLEDDLQNARAALRAREASA